MSVRDVFDLCDTQLDHSELTSRLDWCVQRTHRRPCPAKQAPRDQGERPDRFPGLDRMEQVVHLGRVEIAASGQRRLRDDDATGGIVDVNKRGRARPYPTAADEVLQDLDV